MLNNTNHGDKKRILVFLTGGTICSKYEEKNGEGHIISKDSESGLKLIANFKESGSKHNDQVDFVNTDNFGYFSENMTVENWNTLLKKFGAIMTANLQEKKSEESASVSVDDIPEKYDGIIVAHGTDSLAYSSALVSLLFKWVKIPIFMVSSNDSLDEEGANGYVNFRAAVECICEGIAPGAYVTYKNPSDGHTYLHYASRLTQSANYQDDFQSVGMLDISYMDFDKIREFSSNYAKGSKSALPNGKIINPLDCNLVNDVLKLDPYVGLNYDTCNVENTKYVIHGAYHSGTVCSYFYVKDNKRVHTPNSIQRLIEKCSASKTTKAIYIAPAMGVGDLYDTVPVITEFVRENNPDCLVRFAYGCMQEMYYVKLLIASSLGFSDEETDEFIKSEYCSEFISEDAKKYAIFQC